MTSTIDLHTYYRSSCSARLRIALAYKKLSYNPIFVCLSRGAQHSAEYKCLNSSGTVPTLTSHNHGDLAIGQSSAALEFLEEAFPSSPQLLPAREDLADRVAVRQLVAIIVADTQPLTNRVVFDRVKELGGDQTKWAQDATTRGFSAFEAAAAKTAGSYCVGDAVTLADVVIAPACWNAQIWGVELSNYPTIQRVYLNLMRLESFADSHWSKQQDCPESVKGTGKLDVV